MTKNILAIELGSENLKLVVLQQLKADYKVIDYKILPLSEKAFDMDGYLNVNEVKPTLEDALLQLNVKKMPVALTVNTNKKIVRTRDLPLSNLKELDGIVNFEAGQFLPYGIDQFYLDYRVIGSGNLSSDNSDSEKETGEAVKVMIGAVPKDAMNPYLELLNACNCKILSITLHTDAIYSYAKQHFLEEGSSVVICDIGENSINTILFENYEFLADISSDNGMFSVIDHFSIKHGISHKDSKACLLGQLDVILSKNETEVDQLYRKIEKLNQFVSSDAVTAPNTGSPAEETSTLVTDNASKSYKASDAIQESISEVYADILKEISRMMEFYRTRRFGTRVNVIYLCGGGSKLVGLHAFLKQRLDIDNIHLISENNTHPLQDDEDLNLIVAAIGGALGR